jgi:hypothetical protein
MHKRTGPVTAAGKAKVSLNRTKHALYSKAGYEMVRYVVALNKVLRALSALHDQQQ